MANNVIPIRQMMTEVSALNAARLQGLRNLEQLSIARRAVDESAMRKSIAIDVVTVAMRRALDHIPAPLLIEIAEEVAREYRKR